MKHDPILMEDYFDPGIKTKPAVHVGTQAVKFFRGNSQEQAWEGYHLAAASKDDVAVVRNIDPEYLKYWKALMDDPHIINLEDDGNLGEFLTQVILDNKKVLKDIREKMAADSRLMVFIPTELEKRLAYKLGIPLHGSPAISSLYGVKSGIRRLAAEAGIPMTPGFICSTLSEVKEAINILRKSFDEIIIKHDISLSGYFSKKLKTKRIGNVKKHLDEISGGKFTEGRDIVVVEGWIKGKVALCAHIEILEGQAPIICGGWQQIMDKDGISYMGAGPLMLSPRATKSFMEQVNRLAIALKNKGAVGSYGPDFLVVSDEEKNLEPDTCVLIELNARIPYTAFPLEIIKQIKGKVGNGFLAQHIKLTKQTNFAEIRKLLLKEGLLITKKSKKAKGVVPYNIGLLRWDLFDVLVMADSWEETERIASRVRRIFSK